MRITGTLGTMTPLLHLIWTPHLVSPRSFCELVLDCVNVLVQHGASSSTRHVLCSLAADLPGVPGTIPVYSPIAAVAVPLEPPSAPLVPLPPKKSSLMGIKSAVVSTTLLATQALGAPLEAFRRKSSSANEQMATQEAEVRPVACQTACRW